MLFLALLGCDGGAPQAAPATSGRVDVVAAAPAKAVDLSVWCDSRKTGPDAPALVLPELDGPPVASGAGWTWVNVWATWCGPCVAEMPMIRDWQARLAKEGLDVSLQFLSVDEKADVLAAWKASHPEAPPTMRVKEYAKVASWLTSVGSDGSTVPVQVLADPEGKVRCVRSGALEKDHYEAIKAVVRGG